MFKSWRASGWTLLLLTLGTIACFGSPVIETAVPTLAPSPTVIIAPTQTATPVLLDKSALEQADRALFNGDWDHAITLYREAREAGIDQDLLGLAWLGEAKALVRASRWSEAVMALNGFVERFSDHESIDQAHVLLGQAYESLGQLDLAIVDYHNSLRLGPGAMDSYILRKVGDLQRMAGRPLEAIDSYQNLVDSPGISNSQVVRLEIAEAFLEAGQAQEGFATAEAVYQLSSDPATKATANLLMGLALESLGDWDAAQARYLDSVNQFPEAYDSYTGLVRLVESGVPVDEFQRGYVDFNAGVYTPALAAFDRYLAESWDARGLYYRGLTRRALSDPLGAVLDFETLVTQFPSDGLRAAASLDLAFTQWAYLDQYSLSIETYLAFVAAAPGHISAPEALFAAGRTAERVDDLAYAAELWLRLPAEYPAHPHAYQGAFEAGVVHFRLGEFLSARQDFELGLSLASAPGQRAASLLWMGKCDQAVGDPEGANLQWQLAVEADPTGYYSVRAADLLEGLAPFDPGGLFDFSTDPVAEQAEAEAWLRSTFGISGPDPLDQLSEALAGDSRLQHAAALLDLGLTTGAIQEFEILRELVSQNPEATYRLMHFFLDRGMYRQAILASRQILQLAGMDDAQTMAAPVFFNRVRFGPYYGELILPAAVEYGFDGLFLLSVIRQESLFESAATSYAAAHGLMQVIPSTGQSIADALAWPPDYSTADLYRPLVSVEFGTYYLGAQRDRFEGDLFAALAAYNAGPGNALVWKELAPADPDLFLEVIRLNQPHLYIRTIYEVFAIYRDLYVHP